MINLPGLVADSFGDHRRRAVRDRLSTEATKVVSEALSVLTNRKEERKGGDAFRSGRGRRTAMSPNQGKGGQGLELARPGPMQGLRIGSLAGERAVPWVRQLLSVGAIVRWVGLGVAGIIGLIAPPRAPGLVVVLILSVGVYNAASMLLVRHASDQSVRRIARTVTTLDELGCLAFLAIFTGLPGGTQIAFYVPMVVEAVAFDGVIGAVQSVAVFTVGIIGVEWAQAAFFGRTFSWAVVLLWTLVMLVVAVSLAALDRTMQAIPRAPRGEIPAEAASLAGQAIPSLHLSGRERDVLRLIAAGYSDAMIAARLHLSETTVKTHVGTLRTHLGAKTRAEAVAIASRLNLLEPDGTSPQDAPPR